MNLVIGATFLSLSSFTVSPFRRLDLRASLITPHLSPPSVDAITPAGAFGFYSGLCLLGWLFCLFFYPETFVLFFSISQSRRVELTYLLLLLL